MPIVTAYDTLGEEGLKEKAKLDDGFLKGRKLDPSDQTLEDDISDAGSSAGADSLR